LKAIDCLNFVLLRWLVGAGEAEERGSLGHRVLVFAQLRGLLDLVERDVLLPGGVSYLRLDGNVVANK
jgi:SNF2 family DNA or RNA helicase